MNAAQGPNPAPFPGLQNPPGGGKRRNPPKAIQLLVPVWGATYTSQFVEVSLPTLLSPGNLPALAKALPCKFIFLTSSTDATDLQDHAAIHYLRSVCDVEFSVIDDLITGDNYSTTITLAYARAVRAAGDAMLDTCFYFMTTNSLVAAELLTKDGIDVSVVHFHTIKPLDEAAVLDFARDADLVVTVEEGIRIGGLGSAITDVLVEQLGTSAPPVRRLGLPDEFPHNYGLQDDLFDIYGLMPAQIAASVRGALKDKAATGVAAVNASVVARA